MYDKGKVITGLALFLGVATFPFWINMGATDTMPKPILAEALEGKDDNGAPLQCVESADYMRANHMLLLNDWRDSVVRDNNRVYVNSMGKPFEKSLTKTCLACHTNKEQFCEACHKSVAVQPYCWSCHLVPEFGMNAQLMEPLFEEGLAKAMNTNSGTGSDETGSSGTVINRNMESGKDKERTKGGGPNE